MCRESETLATLPGDAGLERTEHHPAAEFPGLRLTQVAGLSMEWKERQAGQQAWVGNATLLMASGLQVSTPYARKNSEFYTNVPN